MPEEKKLSPLIGLGTAATPSTTYGREIPSYLPQEFYQNFKEKFNRDKIKKEFEFSI
jgi:hypothetical protein